MPCTRRRAIKTSAVAALMAGRTPATYADKTIGEIMSDLPVRNELFVRLRGGARNHPGMWWFAGMLWGKRALDSAKALFAVEGCSFNTLVLDTDSSVRMNMIEAGFWLDPVTRKPADDWLNPMNHLKCAPVHFMGPQAITFDPTGRALMPQAAPPGTEFDGRITEPVMSGDLVWVGESLIVKGPARPNSSTDPLQSGLPVFTATSLDTYQATRKDLAARADLWTAASRSYQTLGSWYPWMRMGHESGGISFQMIGRKLRSVDELPITLKRLFDERLPGWLQKHSA